MLDAAANRAREALRVLEDHARFVLNDPFLTGRLKQLRHDLAAALEYLPVGLLLGARDTTEDVGTGLSTEREWQRDSLADVVQANGKRLQEALRSLEEFGKLFSIDFAQAVERLRYESYTLERTLVLGQDVRARLADCRLYVLATEALCRASLLGTVREACQGGAQMIQLREKELDDRRLLALAPRYGGSRAPAGRCSSSTTAPTSRCWPRPTACIWVRTICRCTRRGAFSARPA